MIPAWVVTALVIILGCIGALWVGGTLPTFNPFDALFLVLIVAACGFCAVRNDFPMLLALAYWLPVSLPIAALRAFPNIFLVPVWMLLVIFLRLCIRGSIPYIQSWYWFPMVCFAWVPIRFLMSPIHKLGATAGGSGVSGAMPYFNYFLAAFLLVFIGAILTDRQKAFHFLRWSFIFVLLIGTALLVCAFIPATQPILNSLGFFAGGDIDTNIQRLVVLPGYGLFLVCAALCPVAFQLSSNERRMALFLGLAMIIVGGNRSGVASLVPAIPLALFLRRKQLATVGTIAGGIAVVLALHVYVSNIDQADLPPLLRSLGALDARIDKMTGADASADWRYQVWQDGWTKVMQAPLTGKGFGNLPEHLDPTTVADGPPDFEAVLAGGMAHDGFISAAYGFGIPFMLGLTGFLAYMLVLLLLKALHCDRHDRAMRDAFAFLSIQFAALPINIYSFADLNSPGIWVNAALAIILIRLQQRSRSSPTIVDGLPSRSQTSPATVGAYYRG